MSTTFQSVQQDFEQAFRSEGKTPTSITLPESDYNAFCESMFPKIEYSDFERDLLGEAKIAEFEYQRTAYQRQRVTHILCYVTGGLIPLDLDAGLPSGEVRYAWKPEIVINIGHDISTNRGSKP